jgi:hypothetical protein
MRESDDLIGVDSVHWSPLQGKAFNAATAMSTATHELMAPLLGRACSAPRHFNQAHAVIRDTLAINKPIQLLLARQSATANTSAEAASARRGCDRIATRARAKGIKIAQ